MTRSAQTVRPGEVFGLVRPSVDAHTLGISYVAKLIEACGYRVVIAGRDVTDAVNQIARPGQVGILQDWIRAHGITRLGLSYRLSPEDARAVFGRLYFQLRERRVIDAPGGLLKGLYFAGLPPACALIETEYRGCVPTFRGDETPAETLDKLGVPPERIPPSIRLSSAYDDARLRFGRELIDGGQYHRVGPVDRAGYEGYGTRRDHVVRRVDHASRMGQPPLMRVHVGPYRSDRAAAIAEFMRWIADLRSGGLLDIVSIGTSQLTQERFGEEWGDLPNGGGVPINSEEEYARVAEAARPMLVRTYAGTKRIPQLARLHERALNIAWHALSFWWFSRIDGRGPHDVLTNLREHLEALDFIAESGKPFEANIPHHFAFRGGDDVTYIVAAYLAARTAKQRGVRCFILQNMMNTPKYTIGVQDLAKSRAMLRLVRELEDERFRVILQPRAGLDYFSPDLDKAKAQLAAVTAMMDDIEPSDPRSPAIIHVVSYSEASHLADPSVIHESIRIVRAALEAYRRLRRRGEVEDMGRNPDVAQRTEALLAEAKEIIRVIEREAGAVFKPETLYRIFAAGFLPVPYLWECRDEFRYAVNWRTDLVDGGIKVIDEEGRPIPAERRAAIAAARLAQIKPPADPILAPSGTGS